MQAVNHEQNPANPIPTGIKVSAEFVAYLFLIVVALVLRLGSLDIAPMTDLEAIQALPAYHAYHPQAVGNPQAPTSPILFFLQWASFTSFGGTEVASRLPTVLGGILLTLLPLLLRGRLGAEKTFLLSLLLAFSPITLIASRLADPAIWSMVFAMGLLWAVWRYWDSRTLNNALLAAGFFAALLFLAESGGLIFGLLLIVASQMTMLWDLWRAPYETDTVGDEVLSSARNFWSDFPILQSIGLMLGLVLLVSTAFISYPSGFNIVTEVLAGALRGFIQPAFSDAPAIFALQTLFVYSPLLVIFGIIAAATLLASNTTWLDRFSMVLSVIVFVFLLVYQGSKPAYALWLVLPLSYLTARLLSILLLNTMPIFLSTDDYGSDNPNDYAWIKWTIALIVLAASLMLSLNLAELGRTLHEYPGDYIVFNFESTNLLVIGRIGWFIITSLLVFVAYFLFSSMWGNQNALQGYGLGIFAFMLIIGIGTAWNTTLTNLNNPAELWYTTAVSPDAYKLRETLFEIAQRDSEGFPQIPVTILLDESAGVDDDGIIAWLLRDFEKTRFVTTISDAARDQIVLLPELESEPELQGSYVGQSFLIRLYEPRGQIRPLDWLSWLTQRRVRAVPEADTTVLWLRIDVYDGVPVEERPQN